MIERNIGNAERVVRFFFGVLFGGWALMQSGMNSFAEWLVIIFAVSLMLNGIFSRCYLWYVLDISTAEKGQNCTPSNSIS